MKEETLTQGDSLILVADFWESFRVLEARHLSAHSFISTNVQEPMYDALRDAIPRVEVLEVDDLRGRAEQAIRPEEFVVTLDGRILFPRADARIEITRAAASINGSIAGPYRRVARGMAPQLRQQAMSVRTQYEAHAGRPIVLCDDGIGTGQTISIINGLLRDLGLQVARIITVTNPRKLETVQEIPVTTLHPTARDFIWLNERDLYWGLPRSGLSVHRPDRFVAIGGVPYTLSVKMAQSRIGLPPNGVEQFRKQNLNLNLRMWAHLEELHGRRLTLKDCSRLQFFGDHLGNSDHSIVQLIEDAESGELLRRLAFDD